MGSNIIGSDKKIKSLFKAYPESKKKSGRRRPNLIQRIYQRRLVKKLSLSFLIDDPTASHESITTVTNSLDLWLNEPKTPPAISDKDLHVMELAAPLHRKELNVGALIGEGSFSDILAVEHVELDNERHSRLSEIQYSNRQLLAKEGRHQPALAIKRLKRTLLKRPDQFLQAAIDLENEVRLLSSLNHPNIIKVRGVAMEGLAAALRTGNYKNYFFVMDRASETLDKRILRWNVEKTNPGVLSKLSYGRQLASALSYLHERRIVYRDVKPKNIGFQTDSYGDEHLQLFDFGLCRELPPGKDHDDTVYLLSFAGTPRYLCPEIFEREPYNAKADVYSWSIVFHEIISQEKPFGHINDPHLLQQHVMDPHGRPPLDLEALSPVPPSVLRLLERCWTGRIEDRLTMACALHALASILDNQ